MSDKFFFKGRPLKKPKHVGEGFSNKRSVRPGSEESPITLKLCSAARQEEIEAVLAQHNLVANIQINADEPEDISALESLINTPKTQVNENKPKRNDPCSCGSGKKYKKCCA